MQGEGPLIPGKYNRVRLYMKCPGVFPGFLKHFALTIAPVVIEVCNAHQMSVKLAESEARAVTGGTRRGLYTQQCSSKVKLFH